MSDRNEDYNRGGGDEKLNYENGLPKKPQTAFFLYLNDKRDEFQEQHPDALPQDISKFAGEEWRNLDDNEKKEYYDRYDKLMEEYNNEVRRLGGSATRGKVSFGGKNSGGSGDRRLRDNDDNDRDFNDNDEDFNLDDNDEDFDDEEDWEENDEEGGEFDEGEGGDNQQGRRGGSSRRRNRRRGRGQGGNQRSRPLTPFFQFLQDKREELFKKFPDALPQEISQIAGEKWRNLNDDEKKEYEDRYYESRDSSSRDFGRISRQSKRSRSKPDDEGGDYRRNRSKSGQNRSRSRFTRRQGGERDGRKGNYERINGKLERVGGGGGQSRGGSSGKGSSSYNRSNRYEGTGIQGKTKSDSQGVLRTKEGRPDRRQTNNTIGTH